MAIPAGTVRRRLKTALDQLRAALRARPDQPSKGWLGALAPLVPSTPVTIGVIAMKKLVLAIAILVLLLVAAFVGFSRRGHGDSASPQPAGLVRGPTAGPRATTPGLFPAWLAQVGAPDRRIAGQVVAGGAPVAKARVRLGLVSNTVKSSRGGRGVMPWCSPYETRLRSLCRASNPCRRCQRADGAAHAPNTDGPARADQLAKSKRIGASYFD